MAFVKFLDQFSLHTTEYQVTGIQRVRKYKMVRKNYTVFKIVNV